MMDSLRRGARSWIAKILFFFLILSFAVWGIADVFTGFNRGSLAKVGDTSITAADFQQAFQRELDLISRQAGRRITPDQGRQLGFDQRALQRLVSGAAIDTHAVKLGLGMSDTAIAAEIQNEPTLKDLNGQFSRPAFEAFLRQIGLSERAFLASVRKDLVREQLTSTLGESIAVPEPMLAAIHAHNDESRVIEHLTIDADRAARITEPDEAKLKETYEANKSSLRAPEYRKLRVLKLSIEDLKGKVAVSDDEIKAAFEQDKDTYARAERRRVDQIAFKDKAAAEAAKAKIAGGQSFADAAAEAGAKPSDISLGLVAKKDMIDQKIADAAFKLEKDKVSDVIEGRFAPVLVRVTEIQAGKEPALDEVKDRVREKIARERARTEAQKLHDGVDDNRASGKPIKDIAETLKLPLIEVAATSIDNKAPDGKAAIDGPDGAAIARAGFEAEIGVERDPIELSDGGYAWIELLSTTPAADRPFETVRTEVKTLHMDTERRKALVELGKKLVDRIKAGETMAALALEVGGKAETTLPVTRGVIPQGLTQAAVSQAFALPKGGAGTTDTADGKSRILFRVVDVKPAPPMTKEQRDTLVGELRGNLQGDVVQSYVAALQARYGVTINQAELRRLTGGVATQ